MAQATRKQQPVAAVPELGNPKTGEVIQTLPALVPDSNDTSGTVAPAAPVASPLDLPTPAFQAALERRKSNRAALVEWVRAALVESVDYGRIHSVGKSKCQLAAQGRAHECSDPAHWSKPSLWKPGAEKICGMLGVSVHYPTLCDYEKSALQGVELKTVIIRCELRDATGRTVADGIGARALTQDYGDLNKALKMAEKSAHIDATLRMAGLSEVFTQDLEDMQQNERQPNHEPTAPVEPIAATIGSKSNEHKHLEARIDELNLNREGVKLWCKRRWGIQHLYDLTAPQYRELLTKLPDMAKVKARKEADAEAEAERAAIQTETPSS
jgi:hypothetical protein